MDGGGLAADATGAVHTIWRRHQRVFLCVAGQDERQLGPGEQGRVVCGLDGVYLTWIDARPGGLFVQAPTAKEPIRLAVKAADPAIAVRPDGRGRVVVVWEELDAPGGPIRAQIITP
jgi:hypothetical protein